MKRLCPKCWNELNGMDIDEKKFVVTQKEKLCKRCGRWTNVILTEYDTDCFESNIWYVREMECFVDSIIFVIMLPYTIYIKIKAVIRKRKEKRL